MSSDLLAPLARYLIAPVWARWERSPYLAQARRLRTTQYDGPEVIRDRQWEALRSLIDHAYHTSSFWNTRFAECHLTPQLIESFDDFRRLPLLTKQELRERNTELISQQFPISRLLAKKTSGSTGTSVTVYVDEAAQQFKRACTLRSDEWTGWRHGERVAAVWGNPDYLRRGIRGRVRNALLDRATYLDTLKMDGTSMRRFVETLRRRPPSLLFGHAHSLYLLAKFCQAEGGAAFRPKGILSTAMVLHDFERRLIEEVFEVPVTNRYGCEEVSLIACECEQHNGLHVNADGIYLEILNAEGTPCQPGEAGRVVVTDLVNRAMPLLRYEVGDMAVASSRECPCGRGLPLIERVEGRVADYVVTSNGEMISGISLTENFAMLIPGLAQLQIVQEAVDQFLFRIVPDNTWSNSSEVTLSRLAYTRFGPGVNHRCEFVERIPQEPSGKYRFCISKVRPAHFAPAEPSR